MTAAKGLKVGPLTVYDPEMIDDVVRGSLARLLAVGAAVAVPEAPSALSAKEAAAHVQWRYHAFRREPSFDAAVTTPRGRRKLYNVKKLVRIAENLRK